MITVTIDREECISCASCWELCEEFFEEDPDDFMSRIVPEYQTDSDPALGEAPPELGDCVTEAAASCPVDIIHVEDVD